MIGLLDLGGAGLVAAALGDSQRDVHALADAQRCAEAIETGRLAALIVECQRSGPELAALLERALQSALPVLVVCRERELAVAVELLRAGARDYMLAPFEYESLLEALARLRAACAAPCAPPAPGEFVTADPDLLAMLELVRSVAATDATVLIEGESGTGKELLARMVHRSSARARRELISLNCAALPAGLLESELFGHERGAFTGAFQRVIGKFELADRSTLLLDEIGELELGLQAKLLRVVQEKQVQRIGAPRPLPVDFRLVATTNRNLAAMVARGEFREDLYYRLNVVPIRVKPLRERRGDAALLIERLLAQRGPRRPLLAPETAEMLAHHRWPGNVRELQNLLERLSITHGGRSVLPADLPFFAGEPPASSPPAAAPAGEPVEPPGELRTLREMERWLIARTLAQRQGNRTRAAEALGISLRTLRNKIAEYAIREPETLPQSGTRRRAAQDTRQESTQPGAARLDRARQETAQRRSFPGADVG